MGKSADAFRTISEVADWLGVQAHVLRFWESKFTQIKPVKRAGGRRYYRPNDMRLIGGIKHLLHGDGLTIKGVQKILRDEGVAHVAEFSKPLSDLGVDDDAVRTVSPKKKSTKATTSKKATEAPKKPAAGTQPDPVTASTDKTAGDAPFIEVEDEQSDAEVVPFAASKDTKDADPMDAASKSPKTAAQSKTPKIATPDIPPVDDSTAKPGILHHAFACKSLGADDISSIQPLLDRLQVLRDQMAAQHR